MDNLLEAINEHYHATGEYPTVKVSREFYEKKPLAISNFVEGTGIGVEIDDNLKTDWRLV